MTPQQKLQLAITASMEGQQVTLANLGDKISVSQMELVCLCTFAEIGVMSLFSNLDGRVGDDAAADLEKTINFVRKTFAQDGKNNGLDRLTNSTVALLRSQKFAPYLGRQE